MWSMLPRGGSVKVLWCERAFTVRAPSASSPPSIASSLMGLLGAAQMSLLPWSFWPSQTLPWLSGRTVLSHPGPLRTPKFIPPRLHVGAQATPNLPRYLTSPSPSLPHSSCCLPALYMPLYGTWSKYCSHVPAALSSGLSCVLLGSREFSAVWDPGF